MNLSNHATLAVQEDLTEYMSSSSQANLKIDNETSPNKTATNGINNAGNNIYQSFKKSNHVRNASLSSTNQTMQLINGSVSYQMNHNEIANCKKDSNLAQKYTTSISKSGTITKRPVYVYVDYKYEEKVYDKLVKTTTVTATTPTLNSHKQSTLARSVEINSVQTKAEPVKIEPSKNNQYYSPYSTGSRQTFMPNKLEDLFNNSCSANTGTAIDSIADLIPNSIKTSLSSTMQTLSSSLTRNSTNLNTNAYASSITGSDSIGSSRVSSSNDSTSNINNMCKNEESQYQLLSFEDRVKYQNYLANSNRSSNLMSSNTVNNTWSNNFKTVPTKKVTNFLNKDIASETKQNLDGSILRTTLIRPKEFEPKHETSV